ncbi:SMI1/KNR4 family protein [Bremerella sp.]|uniref:SMI1/KNR4 family protein n=1 Tax=Bremerella sp. TaxID=2795602 RepID=UPI00391D34F5
METWRERVERAYDSRVNAEGTSSRPAFYPPCGIHQINQAEERLGVSLPAGLKSLLLESDGLMDLLSVDGHEYFESLWLVWPIEMIVNENQRVTQQGTVDRLFFASAGTDGILFGCPASLNDDAECAVLAWYPMEDRIVPLADSLGEFIEGWLANRLTV